MRTHFCNFCKTPLNTIFIDLDTSPLANRFLYPSQLNEPETFYPLCAYICTSCLLVQVPHEITRTDIFQDNYPYFSSYSDTWLKHCESYTTTIIDRFFPSSAGFIIEIASNDGCLLECFKKRNFDILGIDPAETVASTAIKKGIPTIIDFFGKSLAQQLKSQQKKSDLLVANNVLAHVPDINDFIAGFKIILNPEGVITCEFPHILQLIEQGAFDTIYHEHFSYFSLFSLEKIFSAHGLTIFDAEELLIHGGSLRIYACHQKATLHKKSSRINNIQVKERNANLDNLDGYVHFQKKANNIKYNLLNTLISLKQKNLSIAGYGAPAKGNTLLNFCGIRTDFLDYTVDRNPHKQGLYLPGTRIPIKPITEFLQTKPDCIFILPWNIKEEVIHILDDLCPWKPLYINPTETIKNVISNTPHSRISTHHP